MHDIRRAGLCYQEFKRVIRIIVKRLVDIVIALLVLIVTSPFFLLAAIGTLVSSPGPVFYPAARIGKGGNPFIMFKFRTMHVNNGGSAITSANDPRIFWYGSLLRNLKIDELPQFFNVLIGNMSIVGPRPEDPRIVRDHYTDWMMETLSVRPGITSPGALYYYAYGESLVDDTDPEGSYVRNLLPSKLAIDKAYIQRASVFSDFFELIKTIIAIIGKIVGFKIGPAHKDILTAKVWVDIPLN